MSKRAARAIAAATLTMACALPAWAGDRLAPGDVKADWLKRPQPEDIRSVWPREALKTGQGGSATIACKVTVQGLLSDCRVVSQSPPGKGFGGAALMLTSQFVMKPATHDGQPVESSVRIPINFPSFGPWTGNTLTRPVLPLTMLLNAPTYAQVAAAYPARARQKSVGGHAAMQCGVGKEGQLFRCETISEEPLGLGIGAAARSLAPLFLAPTKGRDGAPINDALIQVSVTFAPEMLNPDAPPLTGKTHWVSAPSMDQIKAALPKGGDATGTVQVVLDCLVVPGGHVSDCRVAEEEPSGKGFGASALAVTPYVQMSVWTAEGLPTVGTRLRVPIRYELATLEPPPAPAKP